MFQVDALQSGQVICLASNDFGPNACARMTIKRVVKITPDNISDANRNRGQYNSVSIGDAVVVGRIARHGVDPASPAIKGSVIVKPSSEVQILPFTSVPS